jgi:hypothetical protein
MALQLLAFSKPIIAACKFIFPIITKRQVIAQITQILLAGALTAASLKAAYGALKYVGVFENFNKFYCKNCSREIPDEDIVHSEVVEIKGKKYFKAVHKCSPDVSHANLIDQKDFFNKVMKKIKEVFLHKFHCRKCHEPIQVVNIKKSPIWKEGEHEVYQVKCGVKGCPEINKIEKNRLDNAIISLLKKKTRKY